MSVRPSGPARLSTGTRTGGRYTDTASSAVMLSQHQGGAGKVNVCHDDRVARFLVVVVPVVSHLWPAVAIGDALAAAGHDVAWCGPESDLRPLVGPDMTILPTGKRSYREFHQVGMAAVGELWDQYVIPLNRFIQGPVDRAVAEYRPDVVLTDQYALAGALAAEAAGVPWRPWPPAFWSSPRRRGSRPAGPGPLEGGADTAGRRAPRRRRARPAVLAAPGDRDDGAGAHRRGAWLRQIWSTWPRT